MRAVGWWSDLRCVLLRKALLFTSELLLFLPLLQSHAKNARDHLLACNIRVKEEKKQTPFWPSAKYLNTGQTFSAITHKRECLAKLCDLSYFHCQTATCEGGHWKKRNINIYIYM